MLVNGTSLKSKCELCNFIYENINDKQIKKIYMSDG